MAGLLSDGYALVVRFALRPGHTDAFDALTEETVAAIRASESGTLMYVIHRDPASPDVRVFYELYRDVEAFDEHERMPHVQRFLTGRADHLSGEPEVWRVTPTGGVVRPEIDRSGG